MLERLDPNPEYWEGKRGAAVGLFQVVAVVMIVMIMVIRMRMMVIMIKDWTKILMTNKLNHHMQK